MKPKFAFRSPFDRFLSAPSSCGPVSTVFAVVALFSAGLHGKDIVWDGGYPTTGVWQNPQNWAGDVAFANFDNVFIGPACKPNYIGADRTVSSMTYLSTCNASFNTSLNTSGSPSGGNMRKLTFPDGNTGITIESGNAFSNTLGNLSNLVGAEIVLQGNLKITHNGSGNYTIAAPITGTFDVEIAGSTAPVIFSNPNSTYSGKTTITSGTLRLNSGSTLPDGLGKGSVVVNGALDLNGTSETINGITGTGIVTNQAFGDATLIVGANNTTSTFDGILQNTGNPLNLTKTGAGVLSLSGTSTYSGQTNIQSGKLVGIVGGSAVNSLVVIESASATSGVRITNNTQQWTYGSLSVLGEGKLEFDFEAIAPSASVAPLVIAGIADFSVTPSVVVAGSNFTPGTYPLMTWSAVVGTPPSVVSLPAGVMGSLSVTGNTLNLVISSVVVALAKANNEINLNLPASWTTGVVPGPADIAPWNSTVTGANTTSLGADTTWAGISITNPGGPVTILGGNTLTLGAAGIDIDMASATADLTLGAALISGAANVWNVGPGRSLTLGNEVSGGGSITKQGAGSATLAGENSFTGGLTLTAGVLNLNSAGALGAATNIFTIGGGTLDNTTGGELFLSGNNPMVWDGEFTFAGSNALHLGSGAVTPNGAMTITVAASRLTVGGPISGNGIGLTKEGPGELLLEGSNSFSGEIVVNQGTLGLSGGNTNFSTTVNTTGSLGINADTAIGTGELYLNASSSLRNDSFGEVVLTTNNVQYWNGNFSFVGPGSLNLGSGDVFLGGNRTVTVSNGNLTVGGVISGDFSLTKDGVSSLVLTGENTFTGKVIINGGGASVIRAATIRDQGIPSSLGAATGGPSAIQLGSSNNNGNLEYIGAEAASTDRQIQVGLDASGSAGGSILNNNADAAHTLTFTNPAFNRVAMGNPFNRTLTLGGSNPGDNTIIGNIVNNAPSGNGGVLALTKSGSGTWRLAGNNTYTGSTVVGGGILKLGSGTVIPDGAGKGNLTLNGTIDMNGFSETLNGLSGFGFIDNFAADGISALTVGGNDQSSNFDGSIRNTAGTLSLRKIGTGTVSLGGFNTYTGATTVSAGTLVVNGNAIDDTGRLVLNGGMVGVAVDETVNTLYYGNAPQAAGTYGSEDSLADNKDSTRFSGTGILNVLTTGEVIATDYDFWLETFTFAPGADVTPDGDADGDGNSNREEYAFGLDPSSGASVSPIVSPLNKTTGTFTYTRRKPSLTGIEAYKVWTSPDLAVWTVDNAASQSPTAAGDLETVEVTLSGVPLTAPKLFVRVTAE